LNAPRKGASIDVSIDGTQLSSASFGVPLPLDPGEVKIVVQAKGHEDNVTQLSLSDGEEVTHQLELGPRLSSAGSAAAGGSALNDRPFSKQRGNAALPFFILGGVGAAAALGGGIWAGIELPTVKDEKNCAEGSCTDVGADAAARGRMAVYLLSTGAVLAVGGFSVGAYVRTKKESRVSAAPLPGGGAIFWRTEL
jgi:hypothetical protein